MTQGIEYYEDEIHGVHDPVWESDADIAAMTETDDPNDEAVPDNQSELRLAGGAIEFLQNLVEEAVSFLETDKLPEKREVQNKPIRVQNAPARKWRGRTGAVTDTPNKVLAESDCRRRVTIYNIGEQDIYVSSSPGVGAGRPDQFVLKPFDGAAVERAYVPLVIESTDDIYMVCALTQVSTYTLAEEFDL